MIKNVFYFTSKALFVLKKFNFLSWIFRHVEKTAWLERQVQFKRLWRHNLVNKQLSCIYCPISPKIMKFVPVKGYNKRNFFLKNHAENETGRLDSELLLIFKKVLKSDSHLLKTFFWFASVIALQKWWKMLFISS